MTNLIPMTLKGAESLNKELKVLKEIRRPKIIASIIEARAHGDLKENAEYHAAKEEQSFCEGRIQEIEFKLCHAHIIDVKNIPKNGKVIFGVTVTVLNLKTKEKYVYSIVGDDEANFKKKLISINSPMVRGLLGKRIHDVAIINTPNGNVEYKILDITYV